jgi:hypothetical protein
VEGEEDYCGNPIYFRKLLINSVIDNVPYPFSLSLTTISGDYVGNHSR